MWMHFECLLKFPMDNMRCGYLHGAIWMCTRPRISEMKIIYGSLIKNTLASNLAIRDVNRWLNQQFNVFIHIGLRDLIMIKICVCNKVECNFSRLFANFNFRMNKFSGGVETKMK